MKLTLLEMVQDILSDLDDDVVNNIDDTLESQQVAQILKTTYFEVVRADSPWLRQTSTLESVSDVTKPNYLKLAEGVAEIGKVWYNVSKITDTKDKYTTINYISNEEFISISNSRDSSSSSVTSVTDFGGIKLLIKNDTAPTCYTSFDDEHLVFDSFDSNTESTMQSSKSQAVAVKIPTWVHTDAAIPDLPAEQFPYFLAQAKSKAFHIMKQASNPKLEEIVRQQKARATQHGWRVNGGIKYPDYGRKR